MIIDTENLNNLSLPELAALLMLYDKRVEKSKTVVEIKDTDINKLFEKLESKGFLLSTIYATDHNMQPPYQHISYSLVEAGRQAIADNCLRSKTVTKVISKEAMMNRCMNLASSLQEIYPMGTKPGAAYMWRDKTKLIAERILKLIAEGEEFTDEEAINATKAYVDGFNGIYEYMQLLKYFIWKNEIKAGEVEKKSQLMSYIENMRRNPDKVTMQHDWELQLK